MRKAHKIFFLLQFIAFIFIVVYQSMAVNPEILLGLFAVVFFLEIGILEQQNKYRKEEIFYHKDENNTVEKQIFKAVDIKDVNNKKIKIPEERKNTIIVSKKEMEFLKKEYYDKQMNYFKSKSEVKN